MSKNSSPKSSDWFDLAAGWVGRDRNANDYIAVKLSQELIQLIQTGRFTENDKFFLRVNKNKEKLAQERDTDHWPDWSARGKVEDFAEASDDFDASDLF